MTRLLTIITTLFAAGAWAADDLAPVSVSVPLNGVFTVDGFDDNDRVQITVQGVLPNTCFKVSKSEAKVDVTRNVISLRQEAYHYKGNCLKIPARYTDVINAGIVPAGKYQVVDDHSGKTLGELNVVKSTRPEADDFLYASLDDAYVTNEDGANSLVLKATFGDNCTSLKEVKVNYTKNAIVVQPIAERTSEDACEAGNYAVTKKVSLPTSLTGSYLLHVRSMNGQAVNKIVNLY